jgi:hypothetical protein
MNFFFNLNVSYFTCISSSSVEFEGVVWIECDSRHHASVGSMLCLFFDPEVRGDIFL